MWPSAWTPPARGCISGATAPWAWRLPCGRRWRRPWYCCPAIGGRIPIEAALIAKNRAPGLDRRFDAQRWAFLPPECWLDAAEEAQDKEFHGHYDIWGGDIDPRAIDIARDNARKAGVDDCIRFEVADAARFHRDSPYGQLVTNPPYGERLLERQEAEEPHLRQSVAHPARRLADAGAVQPHGVRALLRPAGGQEAEALQLHDQVRRVYVRK